MYVGDIIFFFTQLSKRETRLLISPTSLAELGRRHVKKIHTNICFIQHHGESSPHQPGYHSLTGWFYITIEPDANHDYYGLWGQFLHGLFLKMMYATFIVSSNGPGDVSSRLLLLELFWCHILPPNFLAERHTKVAINSVSPSLPLSPIRLQPCLKAQTIEQWPSHAQGGCIAWIAMSSPTGTEQPHKRTFTACSICAHIFGKHPFIYIHVLVCFTVEWEIVISQSYVSGRRLLVLPMGGHDGVDATYSLTSYSCSSYSWCGHTKR
jgi:hypothetical protein